jgi:hypothetical protein
LIEGVVVGENDYTSNFTSAFRREINARCIDGLRAKIQVLNLSAERELGADACVILQNKTEFKAAMFEAKWPRLSTHVDTWDSKQKSTGVSHFHSQLMRQRAQSHSRQSGRCSTASSCSASSQSTFQTKGPHVFGTQPRTLVAKARPDHTAPWTDADLKSLLEGNVVTIADVIEAICVCKQGRPLPIGNYRAAFGDIDPRTRH